MFTGICFLYSHICTQKCPTFAPTLFTAACPHASPHVASYTDVIQFIEKGKLETEYRCAHCPLKLLGGREVQITLSEFFRFGKKPAPDKFLGLEHSSQPSTTFLSPDYPPFRWVDNDYNQPRVN